MGFYSRDTQEPLRNSTSLPGPKDDRQKTQLINNEMIHKGCLDATFFCRDLVEMFRRAASGLEAVQILPKHVEKSRTVCPYCTVSAYFCRLKTGLYNDILQLSSR